MIATELNVKAIPPGLFSLLSDQILAIENEQFEFPWSYGDFIETIRQHNICLFVATHEDIVLAYVVAEFSKHSMELLAFAVRPEFQRAGIGHAMIDDMKRRIGGERKTMQAIVRERNLDAQLFLKSCGFIATKVVKSPYEQTAEDGFIFTWRKEW